MDRIRIIGARFLVSSGIWRCPRYLAGKKWKTKRFQFIIKLDAVAMAMVVGIVSEMAAANECNRSLECDFMESWTTWYTCSTNLHRAGHAKESSIVMRQEIRNPRGSKFRVQRDFWRKYTEYECYIAAGSDADLVADTDGDQVPSDGYND